MDESCGVEAEPSEVEEDGVPEAGSAAEAACGSLEAPWMMVLSPSRRALVTAVDGVEDAFEVTVNHRATRLIGSSQEQIAQVLI